LLTSVRDMGKTVPDPGSTIMYCRSFLPDTFHRFFEYFSGFLTSIGCATFLIDVESQVFELMHQRQINSSSRVLLIVLSS
jgi:hypothetical protein